MRLALLMEDDMVLDSSIFLQLYRQVHEGGSNDLMMCREDYSRILALMDPVTINDSGVINLDESILYCIPSCPSRDNYLEIGRVVRRHTLDQTILLPFYADVCTEYDDASLVYIGILYCDMIARGLRYAHTSESSSDEAHLVMDLDDVSWRVMIQHNVSHVMKYDNCYPELYPPRKGRKTYELVSMLAHDGEYVDPRIEADWRAIRGVSFGYVWDFYEAHHIYPRLVRYTSSMIANTKRPDLLDMTHLGTLLEDQTEYRAYNFDDLFTVLAMIHSTLYSAHLGKLAPPLKWHTRLVQETRTDLLKMIEMICEQLPENQETTLVRLKEILQLN